MKKIKEESKSNLTNESTHFLCDSLVGVLKNDYDLNTVIEERIKAHTSK